MSLFQWVGHLLHGPTEAERRFNELVERHYADWLALAYRVGRDPHFAEDALAEALIALARALETGEVIDDPAAWTATTVTRRICERCRNEQSRRQRHEAYAEAAAHRAPETDEGLPERSLLPGLLEQLPERQRRIVSLHVFEGLSHREIAERLQGREATVRSLYRKALQRLRILAAAQTQEPP